MNLLLWTTHLTDAHQPLLGALQAMGFDGVEVPVIEGDGAHFRAARAWIEQAGMKQTAVTVVDESCNPASADAAVRAAAADKLRWAIEMAHALGAPVLCGPFHSAYKLFSGQGPQPDELAWSAEVLRTVADDAQAAGVKLAVEPLNRFECYLLNTAEQARAYLAQVDHPAVGYLYDTHHAHIEEESADQAISASAAEICHIHISENHRGVPGRGQVAWAPTFAALKKNGYGGWLTIESFSRLDPDFAGGIHIWRDYCKDPMEVPRDGLEFMQQGMT